LHLQLLARRLRMLAAAAVQAIPAAQAAQAAAALVRVSMATEQQALQILAAAAAVLVGLVHLTAVTAVRALSLYLYRLHVTPAQPQVRRQLRLRAPTQFLNSLRRAATQHDPISGTNQAYCQAINFTVV
jgi:hypothetical protein